MKDMNEVMGNEIEMEVPATAEASVVTSTTRDPLSKFKELNEDDQARVNEIVDGVLGDIKGEDGTINLPMLLGILDKLNAEKKSAKTAAEAKAKADKVAQKEADKARAEELKAKLSAGDIKVAANDVVSYKTAKLTILDAKVVKVTDTGNIRAEVTPDTKVLYKGKETTMSEISETIYKVGVKTVKLVQILTLNGEDFAA